MDACEAVTSSIRAFPVVILVELATRRGHLDRPRNAAWHCRRRDHLTDASDVSKIRNG
jgi:hypothetical protein